jgi:hypothetical protein
VVPAKEDAVLAQQPDEYSERQIFLAQSLSNPLQTQLPQVWAKAFHRASLFN